MSRVLLLLPDDIYTLKRDELIRMCRVRGLSQQYSSLDAAASLSYFPVNTAVMTKKLKVKSYRLVQI